MDDFVFNPAAPKIIRLRCRGGERAFTAIRGVGLGAGEIDGLLQLLEEPGRAGYDAEFVIFINFKGRVDVAEVSEISFDAGAVLSAEGLLINGREEKSLGI